MGVPFQAPHARSSVGPSSLPLWPQPCSLLFSTITLVALLLAGGRAEAGAPTETLRAIYTEANAIITAPPTDQPPLDRLAAIRTLFSRAFDFRDAAQRALGGQWKARTAVEQNDFIALFKDTSVCSAITLVELTKQYSILANSTGGAIEFALAAATLYMLMSVPLSWFSRWSERRLAKAGMKGGSLE